MNIPIRTEIEVSHVDIDEIIERGCASEMRRVYKCIYENIYSYPAEDWEKMKEINRKLNLTLQKCHTNRLASAATLGIYGHVKKVELRKQNRSINRSLSLQKSSIKPKQNHKHAKITEIFEKRKANINSEYKRLRKNNRIKNSFNILLNKKHHISKRQLVAFGHSLEIQRTLRHTHYCVNHGQNLDLMIINIAAKCLKKHFEPQTYDHFEILRHPSLFLYADRDINWIQRNITDDLLEMRSDVICGDIFLEHTKSYESALDFFLGRTNIAKGQPNFTKGILSKIAKAYFPAKKARSRFVGVCLDIASSLPKGGNLYSICIPKEKFFEFCYISMAFGKPVNNRYTHDHLQKMQRGCNPKKHKDIPTITTGVKKDAPQVRILAKELIPENDVYVLCNSTLRDEAMQNAVRRVERLIQELMNPFDDQGA